MNSLERVMKQYQEELQTYDEKIKNLNTEVKEKTDRNTQLSQVNIISIILTL
jgi:prefoldin subunit 5